MSTSEVAVLADLPASEAQISAVTWNRLEPRPRSPEIAEALTARVRDPLWMLTRQWQTGEFAGEDAASPAYVQVRSRTGPVLGWRPVGTTTFSAVDRPLEELIETESAAHDLATRIEFGQLFGQLLAAEGLSAVKVGQILDAYRTDYGLPVQDVADTDTGGTRLAALARGRALDGIAIAAPGAALPNNPAVAADSTSVQAAVAALAEELAATLGSVGTTESPAWKRESFEYQVEVAVEHPQSGPMLLRAHPDRDATFEWFAFDVIGAGAALPPGAPNTVKSQSMSTLPAFLNFRGMPNHRWWDFERGTTDFGALTPDRRDIAKLVLMDFMLLHGNDYFQVALEQQVGTVCRIEQLLVHDVFGGVTLVERADRDAADPAGRWTCFSLSSADPKAAPSDVLFLPPTAGSHRMAGEALEDVRFLRDEQANYVWAIEQCAEGQDGKPWIGHERHVAEIAKEPKLQAAVSATPLSYRLQTFVPWNWFPMLPVSTDPLRGETALEQARMRRPDGRIPEPAGRILANSGTAPYRVREEAVPRVGARVVREAVRSRWMSGDTHFWVARRKLAGRGEGSSGLRYDTTELNKAP